MKFSFFASKDAKIEAKYLHQKMQKIYVSKFYILNDANKIQRCKERCKKKMQRKDAKKCVFKPFSNRFLNKILIISFLV